MIKINLALKKQPTYVSEGVGGKGGSLVTGVPLTKMLTRLRVDPALLGDLPLARLGLFLALGIITLVGLDQVESRMVARVSQDLKTAQDKSKVLSGYSQKVKEAETIRANLAADTLLIRTKIETIQKLMNERSSAVNLLLVLSDSVPADVWVTKFHADPTSVRIEGRSAGFGQVSDFIKKLSESTYLSDLNMENTRAERDNVLNSELARFELTAKRRRP